MDLEKLNVYQIAQTIGDDVWQIVKSWHHFDKDTVGKQLIRAADSIAANIAEGFGRYHYRENRLFCYYARGSFYETKTWLSKAMQRNLIAQEQFQTITKTIADLIVRLNNYIKSIGPTVSTQEPPSDYLPQSE